MNKNKYISSIFLEIIRWGTYLLMFTPLIFSNDFYYPTTLPKVIFFRIVVGIIFIFYLILIVKLPNYRPKFNFFSITVFSFICVLFLTSLTGVDFSTSFWGTFTRTESFLTFFHLFIFFIILSSIFKNLEDWQKLLNFSILASIFFVFFILINKNLSISNGGTIGNPSLMASYLLLNIFLALILICINTGYWRIFYGLALLILIPVLLNSDTQGAIFTFWGGLFLFFIGYFIFFQKKLFKKFILPALFFIILIAIITLILEPNFITGKIKTILETPTLKARFILWQISWQAWKERFFLGWGLGNFEFSFFKYFDPKLALTQYGTETRFDRAHNIIFDITVTSGVLGLLSYLSIIFLAFFILFKTLKSSCTQKEIIFSFGLIIFLISYLAQNLFVFDSINTFILFFLILACINFLFENKISLKIKREIIEDNQSTFFNAILIVITIFSLFWLNIPPAKASFYFKKSLSLPIKEANYFFKKATETSAVDKKEALIDYAKRIHNSILLEPDRNTLEESFILIEEKFNEEVKKNPSDFYLYLILGNVYNDISQFNRDEEKLLLAEVAFQKAIKLSPRHQKGYWDYAETKLFQGKYEESIKLLQKAIDLEPKLTQSHWYLAMAFKSIGEEELAKEKVEEIKKLKTNWKGYPGVLKKITEFYRNWNEYEILEFIFEEAVNSFPQNPTLWVGLANVYARLGKAEKAKEAALKARQYIKKFSPEYTQRVEEILKLKGL